MRPSVQYSLLLLVILFLFSCKKGSTATTTTPLSNSSMLVIGGNNQLGYAGKPLTDTIIIKITPANTADLSHYAYSYRLSNTRGSLLIVNTQQLNGYAYVKAIWTLAYNETIPQATIYSYANCSSTVYNCVATDSVKVSANVRKPWLSIYSGQQGGYIELDDINFTDNNNGIVVGEQSGVIRSADGGKTWTTGPPIRADNNAYSIYFSGRDTGLVSTVNNYTFFTYDGGKTFSQPSWSAPIIGDKSSKAYYMLNRNTIYTVGWYGTVAKTTNGGVSWIPFGLGFSNTLEDITCMGKDTCYACGDVGKVIKTTDAGKTWQQQPLLWNNNLYKLYFYTNNIGFAGGQNGILIHTVNGGTHWDISNTGLGFNIIAIRFFSLTHGFIVSNSGEVAETKDAGLTWQIKVVSSYGVFSLNKAFIKDETTVFGLQNGSIFTFDLTQP